MKLSPKPNTPWNFVLDTEAGPENRLFMVMAPCQEKAEELVAQEWGIDVCIVSINGKIVNRRPKFNIKFCKNDEVPTLPEPKIIPELKSEDNVQVTPGIMLAATKIVGWG